MSDFPQGLNLREFTATGINKEDELYKVIYSDDKGKGAGAIELDKALKFINYYTKTDNVRNHRGKTLDMIITLFTGLRRRVFEKDHIYLRRFLAITERKKDEVWGTKWNIKHVFEMFFNGIKAYVAENTDETSILENGDFEELENVKWALTGGAEISYSARFSGSKGLYFNRAAGTATQKIELMPDVYVFHFFLLGPVGVNLKNSAGQYWDAKHHQWSDTAYTNEFKNEAWDDCEIIFKIVPEEGDTLTIEFIADNENVVLIDYVRLYHKLDYPSYTVIIQYEGYAVADKSLHLGKGKIDPDPEITWYNRESYFDHSYIVGRIGAYRPEVYDSLLEIIRPVGIRAFIETVEKVTED